MASQVSHARRVLRVLNSFEQAREERLSYTGRASDLGDSSHQNVGDLTGVSPILEQAAVGEYSAAAERRLGEGRSFSEGISARKHSTSTQIRPTVIEVPGTDPRGDFNDVHSADSSPESSRPLHPKDRFRQAVRDVQFARKHLKNENGPAKDADELWSMMRGAATALGTGIGTSLTGEAVKEPAQRPGWWNTSGDLIGAKKLLLGSWLNILLICLPLGWISHFVKWSPYATFLLNLISLVPLALMLGEITEDLALRFGDTVGGLLNATFGNVVELILSIIALTKELYDLVAYSLIGSVLSNLLLVLGCCFLIGGVRYKQQSFNMVINKISASLLFLAAIALVIPAAGRGLYGPQEISNSEIASVSHGTAILLAIVYIAYLFFQLYTHHDIYVEEEDGEQPTLSLGMAFLFLGGITVLVAFASEWLTDAVQEVSQLSGLGIPFIGLIIVPIAGNACEHITAVFVAAKNKMDLAIGVALGSSIQIAVFVIPVISLIGWAIGKPLSLAFDPFLVLVLLLAVIHAQFVTSDGNSNWLMGLQLIGTYVLIAVLIVHL
ncbi:hypothetical protein WJX84_002308 [Apatococcus fuscideae]|uniref:Vacuolar cation/proton exchanger n=1 Tax=Apatococcus fuscideae TaxID=2026836 RepID=A0AAW1SNG4_9CHLO